MQETTKISGFTLVESAMVIAVMGMILGILLSAYGPYMKQKALETTRTNLDTIRDTLQLHLQDKGHYPCPARMKAAADTAQHGAPTDCNAAALPAEGVWEVNGYSGNKVRIGAVPARALNLPDSAIHDGWGRMFYYAVTVSQAKTKNDFNANNGAIIINDMVGNNILPGNARVYFTVFSTGLNGNGGYERNGRPFKPCTSANSYGSLEWHNCNAPNATATFYYSPTLSFAQSNIYYDDFLAYAASTEIGTLADCPSGQAMNGFLADGKPSCAAAITCTPPSASNISCSSYGTKYYLKGIKPDGSPDCACCF